MSDSKTRRYRLTQSAEIEDDCVAELPETNTGDPAALVDFVRWAVSAYPADRYALVLWNHGAGWKDDDIYRAVARLRPSAAPNVAAHARAVRGRRAGRALFSTSIAEMFRAILFDDTSADFLDNVEMKAALVQATQLTGQPFDLLGFDACLMNMLEVVYQVRDHCRLVVGSQELEPGEGWAYDTLLAALADCPDMPVEELGRTAVTSYLRYFEEYGSDEEVTQSAVLTDRLGPVIGALDELADALIPALADDATFGRLGRAQRAVQRFNEPEYVDLAHLLGLIAGIDERGSIGAAARRALAALAPPAGPVVASAARGVRLANASGLSIYVPSPRGISPLYANLDFARDCAWSRFLAAYAGG
jgi:hypothetical protein